MASRRRNQRAGRGISASVLSVGFGIRSRKIEFSGASCLRSVTRMSSCLGHTNELLDEEFDELSCLPETLLALANQA